MTRSACTPAKTPRVVTQKVFCSKCFTYDKSGYRAKHCHVRKAPDFSRKKKHYNENLTEAHGLYGTIKNINVDVSKV